MISGKRATVFYAAISWTLLAQVAVASDTDIAIGGVDGFEALADPGNTAGLRASGRVRLYAHMYVWGRTDPKICAAIVHTFEGTGPASIEVTESKTPVEYWNHYFKILAPSGLTVVDQAHINSAATTSTFSLTPEQWRAYVDAARTHGVRMVAPIFTPNDRTWDVPFASTKWDDARQRAKYGGGITADAAPWAFETFPPAYRRFIEDEFRWARKEGLQATLILSPPRTATGDFFGPTKKMLAQLAQDDALPTAYIVENFMAKPPPNFSFVVGNEHESQTIAGVAGWLVKSTPRR